MLKSQENHDFEGPEYFFGPSMSNSELFILEKKNDVEKIFRETHKGRRLNEQVESHLQAPQPAVLGSL
jgi:hypothetical protein